MIRERKIWKLISFMHLKLRILLATVSPVTASRIRYKKVFKRKLNLVSPTTLNEKLMFLKLFSYWENDAIAMCADKYMVRNYIKLMGCSDVLNKLYGVWDSVDDINWDLLPHKFVLKCNHGSGYNIICQDKSSLDIPSTKEKLSEWMHEQYGVQYIEQGIYSKIRRKIIAEEFIETSDGLPPKDYKFFCSYGKVKMLFVACDRIGNQTKFDYYWPNWEHIPVMNYFPNNGPTKKPSCLEEMVKYAEILSKGFPLVRVDFYNEGDRIIFGEMTFTHFGCLNTFNPDEYDYRFGELFPDAENMRKWKGIDKSGNPVFDDIENAFL